MRNSKCVPGIARALHHVFIAPTEKSQFQSARRLASWTILCGKLAPRPLIIQQRGYALDATIKAEKSRLPRNEEIRDRNIILVQEDGKLSNVLNTRRVLSDIDLKTHMLVIVQPGEDLRDPPICKILDKKEMYQREKAKKKSSKFNSNPAATKKTIELNWALEKNDLNHRILRMKEFLAKGYKLEVGLAPKRRGKQATVEEAQELIKKIQKAVDEVEGSKQIQPMQGKLLGVAMLSFEGKLQKPVKGPSKKGIQASEVQSQKLAPGAATS